MILKVKVLGRNDEFDVELPETTTEVLDLKKLVERERGIPVNSQRILFKGKALSDAKTVQDYGIGEACKLHLSIKAHENVRLSTKESPVTVSSKSIDQSEDFLIRMKNLLKKHFTEDDAEKVFSNFSEVYEGVVDALSLDDIERIAKYEIEKKKI